jgi:uncharacterized protein (DUF427 family)
MLSPAIFGRRAASCARWKIETKLRIPEHRLGCKGEAAYFSIPSGGERSIDAIWTYETPYEAVAEIKDHLAFYPDRIDAIEEHAA